MSFADPTALAGYGATSLTYTGATSASMARQAEGRYISSNIGTNDEPLLLYINSDFKPSGISTFTVKMTLAKNVAPINGVPQPDDILIVSTQVKLPHRSFSTTDMQKLFMGISTIFNDSTMLAKLGRGER